LALFNTIKIDAAKNIVIIGKYELLFFEKLDITDESNALKSIWKGYKWKFEEPANFDLNALNNIQTFKAKQYKFSIGRLEKNGKTIIIIEGREFANGEKKVSFIYRLFF
jgi:hypothetical protein